MRNNFLDRGIMKILTIILLASLVLSGCISETAAPAENPIDEITYSDKKPELQPGWGVLTEKEYYKRYGVGYPTKQNEGV